MADIRLIEKLPPQPRKKRVAAYCRVSKGTENLINSFKAQVDKYDSDILSNPDWEKAGIYSDEGISGTRINKREGFQQMIVDCEAGKIDLILTKSISRFARNTVDTLTTTRRLKEIGVEVYFEKENISTFSAEGEFMLSLMASFAQEESLSISENIKWSRRKSFENGDPQTRSPMFGYRWVDDNLEVIPEEAEIVRQIFDDYIAGESSYSLARKLNAQGIKTVRGADFDDQAVIYILKNVTYLGGFVLQKTVVVDPLEKKRIRNKGEFHMYIVEDDHEAIIDRETFERVQTLMKERASKSWGHNRYSDTTCFYQKIICGRCGMNYVHANKKRKDGTYASCFYCGCRPLRKPKCGNCQIAEPTLRIKIAEALGIDKFDEDEFSSRVDHIEVLKGEPLKIYMKDGHVIEKTWERRIKYAEGYSHPAY